MRVNDLMSFILKRELVRTMKEGDFPKPWTDDKILQEYRFCNVYREYDTVTKWIAKHYRKPHFKDPDMWFALIVARLVNWPETLAELGFPVPFDKKKFIRVLEGRAKDGEKVFTGAYMIHAGDAGISKARYLAEKVLAPLWKAREAIRPRYGASCNEYHAVLMKQKDMGSFMAAQVICDLKFTAALYYAKDWWTFAASGPGSMRGMSRVFEFPITKKWREAEWRATMVTLQKEIDPLIRAAKLPRLSAQDLQNCLCEFDKYERVRLGEGRPRAKYNGRK